MVVNATNSGSVFRQWTRGVRLARGDFVWIAEADDLADPEFLEVALSSFDRADVVMSYTQSRQIDEHGQVLCDHYLDYVSDLDGTRWQRPYVSSGADEVRQALVVRNTIPNVSAVAFRRTVLADVLVEHKQEIVSLRVAGDWLTYLRLLERGKIAFSPKSLNSHRRHQNGVTIRSFDIQQLAEIVAVQRDTIHRFALDNTLATEQCDNYAQQLYERFGLADEEYPYFSQHPEIGTKASSL